jgi:hypothetical protein
MRELPQKGEGMNEHTPGPWHPTGRQADGTIAVCTPRPTTICLLQDPGGNDEANARLIAAAPALLAALELCYLGMEGVKISRSVETLCALSTVQHEAGIAIRKAKGQA